MIKEVKTLKSYIGKLSYKKDIIEEITEFAKDKKIKAGWFSAIGALSYLEVSEFDQKRKKYKKPIKIKDDLEIISCIGNISTASDKIIVHSHIIASRYTSAGNSVEVIAGHLVKSRIFACEIYLQVFKNVLLRRKIDVDTSLLLWK